MGKVENLILQKGWRGMDLLSRYLPENYCQVAADEILSWERGTVLLTTGFFVRGYAETDGPPGTLLLIFALQKLGFNPVMVTDEICRGFFEHNGVETIYLPYHASDEACSAILEQYAPVGLIAVERCGKNVNGFYENAGGNSIEDHTAPADRLFELTSAPTIGIGDGGNEIGMGKLADVIAEKLQLMPCRIATDHLIAATVSNWGAIALAGCLGKLPTEAEFRLAYQQALSFGYVDGFTGENVLTEDQFPLEVGLQLLKDLQNV